MSITFNYLITNSMFVQYMTKSELIEDLLESQLIDMWEAELLSQPDEMSMGQISYPRYISSSTGDYLEIAYSLN